jgi:hypothetical protein
MGLRAAGQFLSGAAIFVSVMECWTFAAILMTPGYNQTLAIICLAIGALRLLMGLCALSVQTVGSVTRGWHIDILWWSFAIQLLGCAIWVLFGGTLQDQNINSFTFKQRLISFAVALCGCGFCAGMAYITRDYMQQSGGSFGIYQEPQYERYEE